ncbi:uncharacterized protein LOC116767658 [Danaus plexippus]|uniref:uncharacterized protein LOC116767658 n=1 Tax=Danaus plexippus TaxID=13037 RepID=UPI002AB27043|nr:uncharacterized protein LOC116767658 [Danaus plexippus]
MEADSTTYEDNRKSSNSEICLPFNCNPANLKLYEELVSDSGNRSLESQLITKLQAFGLLPVNITCPEDAPTCKVVCKLARVIDRVQWVCEGCSKRQPIRTGSFFFKLQCTILQTLQLILAWCEDAELNSAAQYFDVKPRVASLIYDKLDDLVINEIDKIKLGGDNTVVLSELYPDCMNSLSPDTTEQPHVHRILMLADTKQIPTHYRLHVIREDLRKLPGHVNSEQCMKEEIERVISNTVTAQSMFVSGSTMPGVDRTVPLTALLQHCDPEMQHFLRTRIWSQAVSLCTASRDLCSLPCPTFSCATSVQRYLDTSLYRLRYGDGFYEHMLRLVAMEYTQNVIV